MRTGWAVLFRPRRLFRRIDVGDHRGRSLLVTNLVVAGAIAAAAPSARVMMGRDAVVPWVARGGVFRGELWPGVLALVALAVVAASFLLFLLMTWTEVAGSRFVEARRGGSIPRGVAWSVCAHASYGWVVAAVLLVAGWGLIDLDYTIARRTLTTTVRSRAGDWMLLPPLLGFFAGLMLFEYRVYQGLRACRGMTAAARERGA
jgi:hypothetical protein